MKLLDKLLAHFNQRPHECNECAHVLPSHRARFHAGDVSAKHPIIIAQLGQRDLESDLHEDR